MTVTSTTNVKSYTGDGSTTSFPTTFAFQGTGSAAEIEVIERIIATGAETTKSYTTHYTVTGGSGSTGTVVAASAPANTVQWHIRQMIHFLLIHMSWPLIDWRWFSKSCLKK